MYAHSYTYIHTYIYTCICIHIHTLTHPLTHELTYKHTYTHTLAVACLSDRNYRVAKTHRIPQHQDTHTNTDMLAMEHAESAHRLFQEIDWSSLSLSWVVKPQLHRLGPQRLSRTVVHLLITADPLVYKSNLQCLWSCLHPWAI